MKLFLVGFLFALLTAGSVSADQPTLRLSHGLIKCLNSAGTDTLNINQCMSFGLISVGDSQAEVVELMGNPGRLISGVDTAQIGIFPLTPKKSGDDPYLLITISNKTVTTLVLQGRGTTEDFSFSGITLGDSATMVIELLGSPERIVAQEGYDTELWSYGSYPFSFEMLDDRVLSIQIWMATEEK